MTKKMNRKGFVGGSDVPDIFNVDYGCRRRCWYEKIGQEPDYQKQENYHIARGKFFEPIVAKLYEKQSGKQVKKTKQIVNSKYPFIAGHPDRIILNRNQVAHLPPLEIKCPANFSFKKIQREGIPSSYTLQIQHYINLTDADMGAWAIFNAETTELLTFDVPRDQSSIETIIEAEREFWEKVLKKIEPERLDPSDKRCQNCSYRRTCQGTALTIALPQAETPFGDLPQYPSMRPLLDDYWAYREIKDEAEERLDEIKDKLKEKLEGVPAAECNGNRIYNQQVQRTRWDLKALEAKHPELIQEFKRPQTMKHLRVYRI